MESVEECFPARDEWMECQPYHALGHVSARAAADAIVGPLFSDNKIWLDVAFNYTENRKSSPPSLLHILTDSEHSIQDSRDAALTANVDVGSGIPPPSIVLGRAKVYEYGKTAVETAAPRAHPKKRL